MSVLIVCVVTSFRLADIKWNFAKFLVGRDGKVLARFAPPQSPESFEADITAALN